jgi:hypothetical protein
LLQRKPLRPLLQHLAQLSLWTLLQNLNHLYLLLLLLQMNTLRLRLEHRRPLRELWKPLGGMMLLQQLWSVHL